MKKPKLIPWFFTIIMLVVSAFIYNSCDNRKDYLDKMARSQATAPVISLRRIQSANPYAPNLVDTFLLGTAGYELQYQIAGVYDASSVKITCVSSCDSVVSTTLHADSSFFNIKIKQNSTVNFQVSVSNKFNQTGTAFFALTYKNGKPVVHINKYGSTMPFGHTLTDTCYAALSYTESIGFIYSDDNSNWTGLQVVKGNPTDTGVVTIVNGKIAINYTGLKKNKLYHYSIYGKDVLGVVGDTCFATVYVSINQKPIVGIRKIIGPSGYTGSLTDTCGYPISSTYTMGLSYSDDNSTYLNLHVDQVTGPTPAIGLVHVTSNLIQINYNPLNTNMFFKYKIYGIDPFGDSSNICYATINYYNKAPVVKIIKSGNNNLTSLTDSLKTTVSNSYILNLNILDEVPASCSVTVVKLTAGDNATITTLPSGTDASFTYLATAVNKTYQYHITVTDAQGVVSNTCTFSVYVFKNRGPVFLGFGSHNLGPLTVVPPTSALLLCPYLYNNAYYTTNFSQCTSCGSSIFPGLAPSSAAAQNTYPGTLNIMAYDPDQYNFNGYVSKIKFIPSYAINSNACTQNTGGAIIPPPFCYNRIFVTPTIINTYTTFQSLNLYSLLTYFFESPAGPNFQDPGSCGNTNKANYYIVIYDNDGDSTLASTSIQY